MPAAPTTIQTPMIRTHSLSKRFGDKTVVDRLELSIAAGELFCFLGPNGAGKTTTIKMLTGLLRPSGGRAEIGGFDVETRPLEAKRLLGYIPDHPFLYEKLTGRELLLFVAGLYRLEEHGLEGTKLTTACDALLQTFELDHMADRLIEDYSHGMRQKLSFAVCFLHQPRVVVVDEPWVGLDPKNVRRVKRFLKQQTREGLAVLMSTHTLSIAEELADRVGILHHGRLLHTGSVEEIKALAANPGSLEDIFLELTHAQGEDPEGEGS